MSNNESIAWNEKYSRGREYADLDDFLRFSHTNPTLKQIEPYIHNGACVLEIGSGTGELISYLKHIYPSIQAYGLDYSNEAIRRSQEITRKFNIPIKFMCGDVHALPYPDRHFDIVFGDHVIGHLNNVPVALKEIRRVLKEGGVAAFTVGNSLRPDGWLLYKHISEKHTGYRQNSMFPWTLRNTMKRAGFKIVGTYGDLIFLFRNISILKNKLKKAGAKNTYNARVREKSDHENNTSKPSFVKRLYNFIEKHSFSFQKVTIGIIVRK